AHRTPAPLQSPLFPYTTLFRSEGDRDRAEARGALTPRPGSRRPGRAHPPAPGRVEGDEARPARRARARGGADADRGESAAARAWGGAGATRARAAGPDARGRSTCGVGAQGAEARR